MKNLKNKKGFTIVELVIVIAVIAILAAVLIPTFSHVIDKAQQSAFQQQAVAEWKEAYALDLSDGYLDGKEGTAPVSTKIAGYSYDETKKVSKFTKSNDKWTAKFDGSKWEVTPKA